MQFGTGLGFVIAFAATAAMIHVLARVAPQWGLVDHQNDPRKVHDGAVPVVGGLAMGLAFLATFLAMNSAHPHAPVLAAAIAITLAGGVLDDRHDIGALPKFIFQIAAAAILARWGGGLLTHLGHLLSSQKLWLGDWGLALSIFAIIGVMNAINMIDGLDGLAGSIALSACLCFGFAAALAGDALVFAAVCITTGSLVGFLAHNLRSASRARAAVFMGDTGSLLLGLLLAWFAVRLAMSERPALAPITAVWILAVPLADTVAIMARRVLRGRSPFKADREHLHHILLGLGVSHERIVVIMFVMSLAFGFLGLAAQLTALPEHVMFYIAMAILLLYGVVTEIACRRLGLRDNRVATPDARAT